MLVVEPTLHENSFTIHLPLSTTTCMLLFLFSSLVTLLLLFIIYLSTNTFTLIALLLGIKDFLHAFFGEG
jgi:hypothetical protein